MSPLRQPKTAETAYLGLGGNLGDRAGLIDRAVAALRRAPGTKVAAVSSYYDNAAAGPGPQPNYLNAAAEIRTTLSPLDLLAECMRIEGELGRVRTVRWGPRTIDLDILFYGERKIEVPGLIVPHPLIRERPFVLVPLAEIAPNRLLEGRAIADWAASCDSSGLKKYSPESVD